MGEREKVAETLERSEDLLWSIRNGVAALVVTLRLFAIAWIWSLCFIAAKDRGVSDLGDQALSATIVCAIALLVIVPVYGLAYQLVLRGMAKATAHEADDDES